MTTCVMNVKNLKYATATITGYGDSETVTYGDVKSLAPVAEIAVTFKKASASKYYDGLEQITLSKVTGVDFTGTTADISPDAMSEAFGAYRSKAGYAVKSDSKAPYLALMFELENSDGEIQYITLFKGKLELPDLKGKTISESTELQDMSIKGSFVPRGDNKLVIDVEYSGDKGFDATTWATKWGTSVPEVAAPSASEQV